MRTKSVSPWRSTSARLRRHSPGGHSRERKDVGTVKHRRLLVVAGLAAAIALATTLSLAATGTASRKTHASPTAATISAPPVPNAAAIRRKFKGQKITFIGDNIGLTHTRDLKLVARFQKDTGIKVNLIPHPKASTDAYAQLARNFSSHSSSIDVAMFDVVWPGAFAKYLVDLKPALGKLAKLHAPGIVQNGTIGGKLVVMPWFSDYGILYYRTDLLKKY